MTPPSQIALGNGPVLRRWCGGDLTALHTAIDESHEHLHPWMPWAATRETPAEPAEFLELSDRDWRTGAAYVYGLFDGGTVLGSIGLHGRVGPGGWEIGYWVHVGHTGRGLATAGAAAVTDLAFGLAGTERTEIHCDQANTASAAVPRRLGYRLDRIEDGAPDVPAGTGRHLIWVMDRAVYGRVRSTQPEGG
jgi:RimJ/RimL family protein N-acetyltransferase